MKKIFFFIIILSIMTLFADNKKENSKIKNIKKPDEIELLVNDLLLDQSSDMKSQRTLDDVKTQQKEGYFIQMFVYTKQKPKNLISKIKNRDFSYVIKKAYRNNKRVNLLLVGPYKNETEARKNLTILKNIEKDAFIYKIK